ncbi:Brevis radix-like 3-like protein [Drosera capensis]
MLTCITCKQGVHDAGGSRDQRRRRGEEEDEDEEESVATPSSRQAIKQITSQIKGMAVKATGAYRSCKPCAGGEGRNNHFNVADSETSSVSGRYNHNGYRRTGGVVVGANGRARAWGKEMEARLKGMSSGEATPVSISGRTESIVLVEDEETKEWVAQVEPGVLITFVSIPQGGNELKRIRFRDAVCLAEEVTVEESNVISLMPTEFIIDVKVGSSASGDLCRELFNKWQAQRWWTENHDKVMELYNVQRSLALPTPERPENEGGKVGPIVGSPMTPPLSKESLHRNNHRSTGVGHSSSDSFEHQQTQSSNRSMDGLESSPKLSNISAAKTQPSAVEASPRSSSSGEADGSEAPSVSNASEVETQWVEEDEPGVYITIRLLADGTRELRRVRFSRERFGERHARMWWEENKARIQKQYL